MPDARPLAARSSRARSWRAPMRRASRADPQAKGVRCPRSRSVGTGRGVVRVHPHVPERLPAPMRRPVWSGVRERAATSRLEQRSLACASLDDTCLGSAGLANLRMLDRCRGESTDSDAIGNNPDARPDNNPLPSIASPERHSRHRPSTGDGGVARLMHQARSAPDPAARIRQTGVRKQF